MGNLLHRPRPRGHEVEDSAECFAEPWLLAVLAHLPMGERAAARLLSRRACELLSGEGWWHWLCMTAARDANLYCPADTAIGTGSWELLCKDIFAARHTWFPEQRAHQKEAAGRFSLQVSVRFRPASEDSGEGRKGVVMPLHQKVRIARAGRATSQGSDGSASDGAVRSIFAAHRRGSGSASHGLELLYLSSGKARLPAALRALRNISAMQREDRSAARREHPESADAAISICRVVSVLPQQGRVVAVAQGAGLREFDFPTVFAGGALQADVYSRAARSVVVDFVNGYNGTVLTYGQTGSGKTYTMFGPPPERGAVEHHDGIAQRAIVEVFSAIEQRRDAVDCKLALSYVEVFGNEVSDLLKGGAVVGQHRLGRYGAARATDRVGHRYVLDGDTELAVSSLVEMRELLARGDEQKRRAATAMNDRSTRAHSVVVLSLSQKHKHTGAEVCSRLFLADLGGSEKLARSKVHDALCAPVACKEVGDDGAEVLNWREYYKRRERVQETLHINRGLYALKRCIQALRVNTRRRESAYVPYQDSKLTLLLSEGLGGNSKTALVATAAVNLGDAPETLQTLRFAEGCMDVRMDVREVSASAIAAAALAEVDAEIAATEAAIRAKEHWVQSETLRRHEVSLKPNAVSADGAYIDDTQGTFLRREAVAAAGPAEAVEHRVTGMRLVGAEEERRRLEQLLQRRSCLMQGVSCP
eukprot:TRINITY_DN6113_c0_g1_i1.p1 TRINITY_DN6113_c0_g1~~TRINITY_DN6113_c0_g1_i1.p1  ORF type:complete len:703 (+),score=165.87 TRINITY_DN6113_c0_g1_i1:86-2194(+)